MRWQRKEDACWSWRNIFPAIPWPRCSPAAIPSRRGRRGRWGGSDHAPELESGAQIREGETYAKLSQLYILAADGSDGAENFLAAVTGCTVEASPLDGAAAMDHTDPLPDDIFVDAALVSHVFFDTTCGTNDIFWTLTMDNGDTLRLRQRIVVTGIPVVSYTAADADLTTSAALEAFLTSLDETMEPGTLLELYLPPVVYTEPVNLGNRSVNLYGTSVGETLTFSGSVFSGNGADVINETAHLLDFSGATME